jgi:hypothetical protein
VAFQKKDDGKEEKGKGSGKKSVKASPAVIVKEKEKQLKEVLGGDQFSQEDKLSEDDPSVFDATDMDQHQRRKVVPISMRRDKQVRDTMEFGTQCSIGYDPSKSQSVSEKQNPDAFSKML